MPTFSILWMNRQTEQILDIMDLPGAGHICVDKRSQFDKHVYDMTSVGFQARATDADFSAHGRGMLVLGDWSVYTIDDVEGGLVAGVLVAWKK